MRNKINNIRFTFLLILLLAFSFEIKAQKVINFQSAPEMSAQEIDDLVNQYRATEWNGLKAEFGKIKADQSAKDAIKGLPEQWQSLMRSPAQLGESRLWLIGEKAVKFTGSSKYEFVFLDNGTPLAVSDSNCVLVITRGMLDLTDGNDDALFGVMVHELAHGLFAVESVETKKLFNAAIKEKDYFKAEKLRIALALIELRCDLIAGRIMEEAGYKLSRYADVQVKLHQIEENLQVVRNVQWHPHGDVRKKAILRLLGENDKMAKK